MKAVTLEKENVPMMALKAVIIFDDHTLAARAIAALENAATNTGETVKWDIKSWQSDILKQPNLLGVTVAVATDADLVVLALDGMQSATDELLDWLEHWSEHRRVEDAAVMVFCPQGSPLPFFNELKWFAEWRGLHFVQSHDAVAPPNVVRLGRLLPSGPPPAVSPLVAAPAE